MNEKRNITINLLPQSAGAWQGISLTAFFVAAAFIFNGFSSCTAREAEARFGVANAAAAVLHK